jgi:hypothetical protein
MVYAGTGKSTLANCLSEESGLQVSMECDCGVETLGRGCLVWRVCGMCVGCGCGWCTGGGREGQSPQSTHVLLHA